MQNHTTRNAILAGIGVASLLIYILACTSFSPDDLKVAYPSVDVSSRAVGISVYNRKTGTSEQIFVDAGLGTDQQPVLRPQWLPDGRQILVASGSEKRLTLTMLPYGTRQPVRSFTLELPYGTGQPGGGGQSDGQGMMMMPLPLIGARYCFLPQDKGVIRVDLITGEIKTNSCPDEFGLYAAPGADVVCYGRAIAGDHPKMEFGRIDPQTFALTPSMVYTNGAANSFLTFGRHGRRVAFLTEEGDAKKLVVLREGGAAWSRTLPDEAEDAEFSQAVVFAPGEDRLYATFARPSVSGTETNTEFGMVEIPIGNAPWRWTPLLTTPEGFNRDHVMYLQPGVSHDGRTLAVTSTYLAMEEQSVKPEDCALFLVDLEHPQRKVTKVRMPVPRKRNE